MVLSFCFVLCVLLYGGRKAGYWKISPPPTYPAYKPGRKRRIILLRLLRLIARRMAELHKAGDLSIGSFLSVGFFRFLIVDMNCV